MNMMLLTLITIVYGYSHRDVQAGQSLAIQMYSQYASLAYQCMKQPVFQENWDKAAFQLADLMPSMADNELQQPLVLNTSLLYSFEAFNVTKYFKPQGYIAYKKSSSQDKPGKLVIAFKGTSSVSEWLQNMIFGQVAFTKYDDAMEDVPVVVKVHRGFMKLYRSIRGPLLSQIQYQSQQLEDKGVLFDIVVVGHSLGGALATLLMVDLRLLQIAPPSSGVRLNRAIQISVYTYGQPKVGNENFVIFAEDIMKPSTDHQLSQVYYHRVWHAGDVVPYVPPFRNYKHIQTLQSYWIDDIEDKFTLKQCSMKQPENLVARIWSHDKLKFQGTVPASKPKFYAQVFRSELGEEDLFTSQVDSLSVPRLTYNQSPERESLRARFKGFLRRKLTNWGRRKIDVTGTCYNYFGSIKTAHSQYFASTSKIAFACTKLGK